ncbi:MAG: hypothetical protein JNJ49_15400, partial [Bdellovibrionaceae bacterium]|nr:hypothetical protein [Pseudobdellovibrionaceae bacterium]
NGSTTHTYAFQSGARGPYIEVPTGETVTPNGGTTEAHFGKLKVSGGAFTAPTGVMQIGNDYYYSYTDGFVVSSGTFTHNNGTVEFMGSFSSSNNDRYTVIDAPPGGLHLYDVVMNVRDTSTLYNHGYVEISAGDTVIVNHDLTLKNGRFDGGTIDLYGSLFVQCAGGNATTSDVCADGGTVAVRFVGTGTQTVTQASGGLPPQGVWTVNKSGGSVLLGSALGLSGANQDLTITSGTVDMAGYNLTVARNISNSGTLKRGNSPTCGTVSQGGTYSGAAAICP